MADDDDVDDVDLTDGAGRPITYEQMETWVVAQAVRNELEAFHGGGAADPENPGNDHGFITDRQMRALNIVVRHAVHEALGQLHALGAEDVSEEDRDRAGQYLWFQLSGVCDYMEPPGSEELEAAYREVTGREKEPDNLAG
jgi:hypothetical protein